MRITEYINMSTGEITDNHKEAIEWYRNGCCVKILLNGIEKTYWYH